MGPLQAPPLGSARALDAPKGAGTYDDELGERCRLSVTLATGISEDVVPAANLNYLDPSSVDVAALEADPETFVVPQAGEVLSRLR